MIKLLLSMLITLTLVSCATVQRFEEPIAVLHNAKSFEVQIQQKQCAEPESKFKTVTTIGPHRRDTLYIDSDCADLRAVNPEGEVIGRQSQLSLPPELHWNIK